jgi:hypothetical protein
MAKSTKLRRTHNAPVHPSINPRTSRGTGTMRGFLPGLGLEVNPQTVTAVTKGDDVRRSPLDATYPDLVKAGCLPVFARSGNVSEQLEETGDDQEYTAVGDMTPAEAQAAAPTPAIGIGVGLAIGGVLMWLLSSDHED